MPYSTNNTYPWAIIGAGPAGLASAGLLLEAGVNSDDVVLIDPYFGAGDFGRHWGEVYSNTSVELFLRFLNDIKGFSFNERTDICALESKDPEDYCQLKEVTKALLWVTEKLCSKIDTAQGHAHNVKIKDGAWVIDIDRSQLRAEKVILATGAVPKSLTHNNTEEITLYDALKPARLRQVTKPTDCVAVFGSSHSSMIIMKNLLDTGVNKIINFYLTPHRYAIKMDGWTLYDNTGLKAATAQWVRENISKKLHPGIERYLSNQDNINQHMKYCNKAIYPIGFKARIPQVAEIDAHNYDANTGIIAPGLFGAGIAFPRLKTDPLGGTELSVGLYKFMNDIREAIPIWKEYGL